MKSAFHRITAILLVFLMIIPGMNVFAASGTSVSAGTAAGKPGDQVSVTVSVSGNPGIAYLKLKIGYDSTQLTLISAQNAGVLSGTFTTSKTTDTNPYVLQWMGAENSAGNGVVATLNFQITSNASAGDKTVSVSVAECYNESFDDITLSTSNGKVTVNTTSSKVLSSISVSNMPNKTIYYIGESLDTTGLKIKLTYSDGSTEIISSGFTTSGFEPYKEGQQTITVSYGGRTTSFYVRVDANGLFTISFDANGGSKAPNPQTYTDDVPFTLTSEIPIRKNYLFVGWSTFSTATKAEFNPGALISMSAEWHGDFTLYAVWQLNVITGQCGDNAYFELTLDTGELIISGAGTVWDYTTSNYTTRPYNEYIDRIKSIAVQSGITRVGDLAFGLCYNLECVYLSNTVESIGLGTFASCSALDTVDLGSCSVIGEEAFSGCESLPNIDLKNTTTIMKYAFNNCYSLNNIVIPQSVVKIGERAFWSCRGLTKITVLTGNATFDYFAFDDCDNLAEVHINDLAAWCGISFNTESTVSNPLYIAKKLYINGALKTEITIPESVESINHTFYGCTSIEKVTILNKNTTFDYAAFNKSVIILGYAGSKAEYYANYYGLEFVPLDGTIGDINDDGAIDNKDVVILFRAVSAEVDEYNAIYDFNGDGELNNKDVVALFREVSKA